MAYVGFGTFRIGDKWGVLSKRFLCKFMKFLNVGTPERGYAAIWTAQSGFSRRAGCTGPGFGNPAETYGGLGPEMAKYDDA
jgi:hypothetical protein